MRTKGINGEHAKKANRLLVLRLLCTMREATRTEITRRVGLNKMTVSNITAELLSRNVVYEKEPRGTERSGAGRPQMLLGIAEGTPAAVGIWLARDFCMGVAAAMDLTVLCTRRTAFTPAETAESVTDKITQLAGELAACAGRRIAGVGVAAIGPLDQRFGVLLNPPNFYKIERYPLTSILQERLHCPVYLQNDANAGALAEKYYGCCQSVENFVYVGVANGVGAGLVVKNSLFDGTGGFAGEIGHMSIAFDGPECYCGNRGCLETYLSIPKMLERFEGRFGRPFSSLEEICAFCDADPAGEALLWELLEKLAVALVNLGNLVDPEVVVLGHAAAALRDGQLAWLEERLNARVLARGAASVRVVRSSFGALAPVYGAAVTVWKQVFDGKLLYEELFGE